MSCRMPRQFESIFLNALISIADTRCCPLPPRGVRKRARSERSCYKSRPSSQNAVELNGGFMRRRAGAQDASSCTTCVYPDALRPQSANERHLDDLCLPSVWLSPPEHGLKGKVRTFPWLFSSDKPFNQNYFTQTQNMWGTDSEESYCQIGHTIGSDGYCLLPPLQKTDPCPFVSRPASQSYPANITFSRLSLDNVESLWLSDKSRVTAAQKEAFFPHLHLAAVAAKKKRQ